MELVNEITRLKDELIGGAGGRAALLFATTTAASLIQPFAPHLSAELYENLTGRRVWQDEWPEADPEMLRSDTVTIVVQVNGKLRDRIEVADGAGEADVLELAKASENVQKFLEGFEIVKEIYVPGKLVNLAVRPA